MCYLVCSRRAHDLLRGLEAKEKKYHPGTCEATQFFHDLDYMLDLIAAGSRQYLRKCTKRRGESIAWTRSP